MTGNSKPLIEGGFKVGSPLLTKMNKYTFPGLAILTVVGGAFVGGSIYKHLSEPTGIIESQERFNAIVSANQDFLNDLRKIAEEGSGKGVGFAYVSWKRALSGLNSEQKRNVIKALNNTLDYLSKIYRDDENLINVFNKARELLKKEKETGSSPLTPSSLKPAEKIQAESNSSFAEKETIKRVVPRVNVALEKYLYSIRNSKFGNLSLPPFPSSINENKINNISDLVTSFEEIKKEVKGLWTEINDLWDEDENLIQQNDLDRARESGNKFLAEINKYLSEIRALEQHSTGGGRGSSSVLTQDLPKNTDLPLMPGGIDFTRINYLTQPMGSFQGLDLRLPLLSKAELEGIDINRELAAMERMINSRIDVSTDRLKHLLAAMSQKDAFTAPRETQLLPLLLRLCWLKEERGVETTPDFRAVLLIADTGLFI